MVYTLIVDDLRERVHTERIAACIAASTGAEVELPRWDDEWQRFDEMLASEPVQETPEQRERYELLQALGLRE